MAFCEQCTNLPAAWLVPRMFDMRDSKYPDHQEPIHYWTYSSWTELEDSARSCQLCDLIVKESKVDSSGPYQKTDKPGIRFTLFSGSRVEIWCEKLNRVTKFNIGFDRDDFARIPPNTERMFDARIVSKRAGDDRNIRTILHWTQYCNKTHTSCSSGNGRKLPTRVLDVGSKEAPHLKLYASQGENADYVALSYCWGLSNNYMTNKSNIAAHLLGIVFDDLPPTIQDAISLTRLLGLRYVWIDALCIIQDDREDWTREASKMHTVYSQATLVIAADMFSDTSSRLFFDRSKRHDQVLPIPWPLETPDKEPLNLYIMPTFRYFKDEIARGPLSKRGWTFQERALSTRILHMGEEMCYWECREACIGEDDEIGKYNISGRFFQLEDIIFESKKDKELTVLDLHSKWAWVVEEYSKRQLTMPGDKFSALEGITTRFAAKGMLGKHFCGLWENEFLRHLLWVCSRQEFTATHTRPPVYRAPSWSWAAIDGPIKSLFIEKAYVRTAEGGLQILDELGNDEELGTSNILSTKILQIKSIEVETEGETLFGSVIRGVIQAKGLLIPITRGQHLRKGSYLVKTLAGDVVGLAVWDVDDYGLHNWPNLWLCPVMECRDPAKGWHLSECLVLKPSDDSGGQSMSFERLAKARVHNFFSKHVEFHEFAIV